MKIINRNFLLLLILPVLSFAVSCKGTPEPAAAGAKGIFAGVGNVFIIADDGSLWSAGFNQSGQLGLDPGAGAKGLVQLKHEGQPFTGILSVAAGENHTVIVKDDGTLWGVGESLYGELAQGGDGKAKLTGLTKLDITGVKFAAAGNNSTFVIKDDGTLWAAGFNYYGELGLGDQNNRAAFTQVASAGRDVKEVVAGARHTVLLKNDGSVWSTGYNYNGQLGIGTTDDAMQFTQARSAGTGVSTITAGNYHTVIIKSDGSVHAAGANYNGQLGTDDGVDRNQFTQVKDRSNQNISGAKSIAARGNMTLIHSKDNALLLAGSFADPKARDEKNLPPEKQPGAEAKSTFIQLEAEADLKGALDDVKQIILGSRNIFVVTGKNQLLAAGSNRYGQISDNQEIDSVLKLKQIYP